MGKGVLLMGVLVFLACASLALAIDVPPAVSLTSNTTSTTASATLTAVAIDPDTAPDTADIVSLKILKDGADYVSSTCSGVSMTCVLVHVTYESADGTHVYTAVGTDDEGHEVTSDSVTVTYSGTSIPPNITFLPNITIDEDSGLNTGLIDLWDYTIDFDTPIESLVFSITDQSLPTAADCTISSERFIDCATVTGNLSDVTSTVSVQVFDGEAYDNDTFSIYITPVNDPVVVGAILGTLTFPEDSSAIVDLGPAFTDPDSTLTYTFSIGSSIATGSLTGALLNISGAPNAFGLTNVTVNASDGFTSASQKFLVNITPVNDAPNTSIIPNQTWAEDTNTTLGLAPFFSDIDSPDINWSVAGNVFITITINQTTGIATFVPAGNFTGVEFVTFNATDGFLNTFSNVVTLNVTPVNDAPVFNTSMPLMNITMLEDTVNSSIVLAPSFFDIDGPDINWTKVVTGLALNVTIDPLTGVVSIIPPANASGNSTIIFTATDGSLTSGPSNTVTVRVLPVNDAPFLISTLPNVTFPEDTSTFYSPAGFFGDIDNTTLLFNVTSDNPFINATFLTNGTINISSAPDFFGTGNLTITASDGEFSIVGNLVVVVVSAVDDAPVLSAPITNLTFAEEGTAVLDLAPFFTDVDNATLIYIASFNSSQVNVTLNGTNATITGKLDFFGSAPITFSASDGTLGTSGGMTATITPVNDAPIYSPALANQSGNVGLAFLYDLNGADVDGDTFTFNDATAEFTISNTTGIISFVPIAEGTITASVNVCDPVVCTPGTFDIVVGPPVSFILNSTFNGTLFNGTFSNFTGVNVSTINNSRVYIDWLIQGSNVQRSLVNTSILINDSIMNSQIYNSSLTNCVVIDSVVKNYVGTDCIITSSFVDPPTGTNNVTGSTITSSTLMASDVLFSTVTSSTITNSTKVDSTITNSTVTNSNNTNTTLTDSTESDSTTSDSTITAGSEIIASIIDSSVITNSTVSRSNITNASLTNTTVDLIAFEDGVITGMTIVYGTITINGTTYVITTPTPFTDLFEYPPVASFTATTTSTTPGSNITFTSTSSDPNVPGLLGDSFTLFWTFGDGTNDTASVVTRSYGSDGTYTVTLLVTDSFGMTSSTSTPISIATPPAPSGGGGSGGGGGGGGGSGSSTSSGGSAPGYNLTKPIAFPEIIEDEPTPSAPPIEKPKPKPVAPPITAAVVTDIPMTETGIGFTIILGILLLGLAGYFIVKKILD